MQPTISAAEIVRLRVGTKVYTTCLDTLTQFPDTLLHEFFSPPFPLLLEAATTTANSHPLADTSSISSVERVHVMPPQIIANEESFDFLLDFLRTGTWLPMFDRKQYAEACSACRLLGIPSMPQEPPSIASSAVSSRRIQHVEVCLLPPTSTSNKQHREALSATSACPSNTDDGMTAEQLQQWLTVSQLGDAGFKIVAEYRNSVVSAPEHCGLSTANPALDHRSKTTRGGGSAASVSSHASHSTGFSTQQTHGVDEQQEHHHHINNNTGSVIRLARTVPNTPATNLVVSCGELDMAKKPPTWLVALKKDG